MKLILSSTSLFFRYVPPRKYITPTTSKKIHYPGRTLENSSVVKHESCVTLNNSSQLLTKPVVKPEPQIEIKPPIEKLPGSYRTSYDPIKVPSLEKEVLQTVKTASDNLNKVCSSNGSISYSKLLTLNQTRQSKSHQIVGYVQLEANMFSEKIANNSFKLDVRKQELNSSSKVHSLVNASKSTIPGYVQDNLRKLIAQNPDGVWCAELPTKYK